MIKKMNALGLSALPLLLMSSLAWGQEEAPAEPAGEEAAAEAEEAEAEEADVAAEAEVAPPTEAEEKPPAPASEAAAEEPLEESAASPVAPELVEDAEEAAAAATADVQEEKPSLLPLTLGTSTWSRFEMRQGYDTLGTGVSRARFQEGDLVAFRARLKVGTNPLDLGGLQGSVHMSPQASGVWGASGTTIGEANMGLYEGYFKLAGERAEVKAGRIEMNYGDALLIGNLGWHQTGRAFDGVHAKYKMNKGYIDAFATQVASGWGVVTDPFLAGDTYFWGLYAGIGGYISDGMDLDLYLLGLSVADTDDLPDGAGGTYQRDGATLLTAGARAKQKLGFIDYRVEADFQFGDSSLGPAGGVATSVATVAYQADAELGLNFSDGLRLGVGALIASGDDPGTADQNEAFNDLFPTGHKWLGLMDVIGARSNVTSAFVKFNAALGKGYGVMVHGHVFGRPSAGGLGRPTGNEDGLAGFEVDAQLAKKIGKYALVRGLYGIFIPNEGHYGTNDTAHYVEIQAGIEF